MHIIYFNAKIKYSYYFSYTEKTIVLNMLRMAAIGEIDPNPQQVNNTPSDTHSQIATPNNKQTEENKTLSAIGGCHHYMSQSGDIDGASPFKLPQHDTIIRDAHSRLMSRGSDRSFHERLQSELDQDLNKSSRLNTPGKRNRPFSFIPDQLVQPQSGTRKSISRSHGIGSDVNCPPPPVHVHITQERLQDKGSSTNKHNKYY